MYDRFLSRKVAQAGGRYVFPFSQGLEIPGNTLEDGVCLPLVYLWTKYIADVCNQYPNSQTPSSSETFFRNFRQYLSLDLHFFLRAPYVESDGSNQDGYIDENDRLVFLNNEIEVAATPLQKSTHRKYYPDTPLPQYYNGISVVKGSTTRSGHYSLMIDIDYSGYSHQFYTSERLYNRTVNVMKNICRIEKQMQVRYCFTKFYLNPTAQSEFHDPQLYQKSLSISGVIDTLCTMYDRDTHPEIRFTIATLSISSANHIVCLAYNCSLGPLLFFDPNLGIVELPPNRLQAAAFIQDVMLYAYNYDSPNRRRTNDEILLICNFFNITDRKGMDLTHNATGSWNQ